MLAVLLTVLFKFGGVVGTRVSKMPPVTGLSYQVILVQSRILLANCPCEAGAVNSQVSPCNAVPSGWPLCQCAGSPCGMLQSWEWSGWDLPLHGVSATISFVGTRVCVLNTLPFSYLNFRKLYICLQIEMSASVVLSCSLLGDIDIHSFILATKCNYYARLLN